MKKALLVATRAELGGAQRVVLELAQQLTADAWQVVIASGEEGWLLEEARSHGIETHTFRYLKRTSNPLATIFFVAELYSFLRSNKDITVVHLNSSNALAGSLASKIARARSVFTVHGLSILDRGYKTNIVMRVAYWAWFRLWFTFTDRIVAVSSGNATRLGELHLAHTCEVIPNGIASPQFLSKEAARRSLGLPLDHQIVMTLGRLEYAKRQDLLIDAWKKVSAQIPDARLIIVGDGPERIHLEEQVHRLKLTESITFMGTRNNMAPLLPAANIFVLTSRYEGWPIVLLETLAAGVPIIASNVGGIHEQVGDAALLIPHDGDAHLWAENIINLLDDAKKKADLGVRARGQAERWTVAAMARSYERVYED